MALDNNRSSVAHLLRRAGFGATPAELDAYAALGFTAAVDALLHPERTDDSAIEAAAAAVIPTDEKKRRNLEPAKYAWVLRMLGTRRPLQEKMTLFWHNHFATANSKVGETQLMVQQIQLFRDNALGSFETLLGKVARDPAMLIWLDNRLNRKGAPNENFGREVMELFTLGIGHYTDDDVKQAARAVTGFTLNKDKTAGYNPKLHDNGLKTIFGVTQNWDTDMFLAALVRHPAHAPFLTTKLYRYFVSDSPSDASIARLSATYVQSGFSISAVLRDIFTGPEFLTPGAFHAQIKQPADLVVGSLKTLGVQNVGPDIPATLRRMGQDLLNPPDVSGWKGGASWINASTLFERFNFTNHLAAGRDPKRPYFTDVAAQVATAGVTGDQDLVDYYLALLVDSDATPAARQALVDYLNTDGGFTLSPATVDTKVRGLVHLVTALPSYQLN